ncbi:MAG TPA: hypothetical protein V6D07_18840 [Trichocoleus sp.]
MLSPSQHDEMVVEFREGIWGQYQSEIKSLNALPKTYPSASKILVQQGLLCELEELYAETKGRLGRRATLPPVAQAAINIIEAIATLELREKRQEIISAPSTTPATRHMAILELAYNSGQKALSLFPWRQ